MEIIITASIIVAVFLFFFAAAFGTAVARLAAKRTERLDGVLSSIQAALALTEDHIAHKMAKQMQPLLEVPPPKFARRVYCALLVDGGEYSMYARAANSAEEFAQIGKQELGGKWKALVVNFIDVWSPPPEVKYVALALTKSKKSEENLERAVHVLQYVSDNFCDNGKEKVLIKSIISRVRDQHEHNSKKRYV